jgi:oxygen-independent coproporphyrinogen-3 oxidase
MHAIAQRFGDLLYIEDDRLIITPEARALTRIVAGAFDSYNPDGARYSQAS